MNRIFDFLENDKSGIMKIIGATNEIQYNYLLRKIYYKSQSESMIVFSNGVPFPSNTSLISVIQDNSYDMNLNCIEKEEINLTNNDYFNKKLKLALDAILGNVLREHFFKSENVKRNFFVKEIVWIYGIISNIDLSKFPTIIYYGKIDIDEIYFLEILASIGFKILIFSSDIDITIRATENVVFEKRLPYVNFNIRVANGLDELPEKKEIISNEKVIVLKSVAKQAKEEIENDFLESGIFKPWKFRKGYVKSLNIDSVIEDVYSYWNEDSRFRPNFRSDHSVVYVPNFFMKINGTYIDKSKYKLLIEKTTNQPLTIVKKSLNLVGDLNLPTQDIYSLIFVLNEDRSEIDFDLLKKHSLYNLNKYNTDVQLMVVRKLNEFYDIFKDNIEIKDFLDLIFIIINLKEQYMVLIENFDFPYKIPKLVIYLSKRETLNKLNAMLIHFFNILSFDILIYSPIGSPSIEDFLFEQHLSVVDLEDMVFDLSLSKIRNFKDEKKQSMFKKIFSIKTFNK